MSDAYMAENDAPSPQMQASPAVQSSEPAENPAANALALKLLAEVERAEKKWAPAFKKMRANMRYASGKQYRTVGAAVNEDDPYTDDRLKVEIVQRHVGQRTAALYARNPTIVAKRRPQLDFAIWDGKPDSLMKVAMRFSETGVITPEDEALFQDVQQGMSRRQMMTRIGQTLQITFRHFMDNADPPFKLQAKQLIPRILTCGVAYIKPDYQRIMGKNPDEAARLNDAVTQLARIDRLRSEGAAGKFDEDDAEYARLQLLVRELTDQPDVVLREGLTFSFPRSTTILPDDRMTAIEGFLGTHWVAEVHHMTVEDIFETYGTDVSKSYTSYSPGKNGAYKSDKKGDYACVYVMYHKRDNIVYVLCKGFNSFLKEPASPDVYIKSFYPWVPILFNRAEDDENPFPRADVELLMPLQNELNRTFESLRQHRIASRPLYVTPPGALEDEDKESLANHPAHAIIELANLPEDGAVDWVLKQVDKAAIDPNVYATAPIYEAIARVVGGPDVAMGGNSRGSATGDSIAEAGRVSALSSNADDLDEALSQLAEIGGGILLLEASPELVKEIAGVGAVWPQFTRHAIANELFLSVKGGSTGRPNKAQDIAMFERMYPFLVQIGGLSQEAIAEYALTLMDDTLDLAEFMAPGAPSIVAANANMQPSTGDPNNDPQAQGGQGGNNSRKANGTSGGGQPAYPASTQSASNSPS